MNAKTIKITFQFVLMYKLIYKPSPETVTRKSKSNIYKNSATFTLF